jgi:hypothetical protein
MKILYDDEVTPSIENDKTCPKFVLEDDGKTITLFDRSGNEAKFTKEEYNRFVNAIIQGKVKPI